jgi:hypothetical protein
VGEYDYVCTYPEHWKVMFGQLIVVKDLDAMLQASAKPLPAQAETANHHHNH